MIILLLILIATILYIFCLMLFRHHKMKSDIIVQYKRAIIENHVTDLEVILSKDISEYIKDTFDAKIFLEILSIVENKSDFINASFKNVSKIGLKKITDENQKSKFTKVINLKSPNQLQVGYRKTQIIYNLIANKKFNKHFKEELLKSIDYSNIKIARSFDDKKLAKWATCFIGGKNEQSDQLSQHSCA